MMIPWNWCKHCNSKYNYIWCSCGHVWGKNNNNFDLYYTDTDSIVINHPLPDEMVGPELGQFKLEYEITDAIFLAPKVYGFVATDGTIVKKPKGLQRNM